MSDCVLNNHIVETITVFTVHILCESPVFLLSLGGVIRDAPVTAAGAELFPDFSAGAFVFAREGFQTAILHKISEIVQTCEVAGNAVVIANTSCGTSSKTQLKTD